MADDGQDGMPAVDTTKDQQQQSKALDSLTDHVEERQLDSNRVQQAMASISARADADRNAQRLKMSLFLSAEGLKGIVDGTIPKPLPPNYPPTTGPGNIADWESDNAIALSFIANRLENTQIQHITAASLASEAWRTLESLKLERELELSKVKINPADVDIMVEELELDRKVAEKRLREHMGDSVAAIRSFLDS